MESTYLQALFETNRKTENFHNIKDYPRIKKLGYHTKPQKNKQNRTKQNRMAYFEEIQTHKRKLRK
jgi:transposase